MFDYYALCIFILKMRTELATHSFLKKCKIISKLVGIELSINKVIDCFGNLVRLEGFVPLCFTSQLYHEARLKQPHQSTHLGT